MRQFSRTAQRSVIAFPKKVLGLPQSFFCALLLSIAAFLGLFTPVDGRLQDIFVTHGPSLSSTPRRVVLIDSPVLALLNPNFGWIQVVDDLIALGAQQIVFTTLPAGDSQIMAALHSNPRVVLGSDLTPDPENAGSQNFDLLPALRNSVPHAVADTPEALLNLHRYQRYSYLVGDRMLPSIEALTARRLGHEVPEEGSFLINFGGAERAFPRMRLQQVIEGKLIKEVIQDRVVLIGIGKGPFHRNVVTPITTENREVTQLEYHGYALDSLLSGAVIGSLPPLANALLLVVVWLVYFFVAQPMSLRAAMVAGNVMAMGLFLLAWFVLVVFNVQIPVTGSILVIGTTLVFVLQHKAKHHDRVLEQMVNSANLTQEKWLKAQLIPAGEDFWPYALGMVDQALPITRAVLFERVPGTSRLRAVHSLRCSPDTISVHMPDMTHEPFASSVKAGDVVEIRHLLKPIDGESRQFLAPLVLQGECLGCFAFGIGSADQHVPTLLRAASALSKRLAEMMLQNQRLTAEAGAGAVATGLRKYFSDKRNDALTLLEQHLKIALRHSEFLETVLHRMRTPTIIYDLFGRPLFANNRMKSVMKDIGLIGDPSFAAAGLIEHACGLSAHQSRLALTSISIDGDAFDQPAWIGAQQQRLQASTLGGTTLSETTYEDMLEKAHGLVFQLQPQDGELQSVPTVATMTGAAESEQAIDLWSCLELAAARVTGSAEFEGLCVTLEEERTPAKVRAVPFLLEELLVGVLRLLAYDARLPGDIVVRLTQRERMAELDFHNTGFGMPDERLQAMLEGPIWPQSPTLRKVRQLRGSSLGENGTLSISSSIGNGYHAVFKLQLIA